jgi:hypothetical protein
MVILFDKPPQVGTGHRQIFAHDDPSEATIAGVFLYLNVTSLFFLCFVSSLALSHPANSPIHHQMVARRPEP